jgi:hypothetical protein
MAIISIRAAKSSPPITAPIFSQIGTNWGDLTERIACDDKRQHQKRGRGYQSIKRAF